MITSAPTYTEEGVLTYTCICGATKTEAIPVLEMIAGDINHDGAVDASDVAILRRHLAGWDDYESIDSIAADVNKDGNVDASDVALLRRYLAGWDDIVLQ